MNPTNLVLSRMESEGVVLAISHEQIERLARAGESLRVEVNVVELQRRRARLAFRAPQLVTIRRTELEEVSPVT